MERSTAILVVGAGIAGLSAALAFARAGFAVDLVERSSRLEAVGAGLQLSPNVLRVLAGLGLDLGRLNAVAARTVTLRSSSSGRVIATVPVVSSDGTAYLSLHRADLQRALLDAVAAEPRIALTLGSRCTGVTRDGTDLAVAFQNADGSLNSRRAGVVIAADGVGSALAASLGFPSAVASGDVAWRMTVDRPCSPQAGIEAWLGPKRHAVAYPIQSGQTTNLVLIGPRGDAADDLPGSATKAALLQRFRRWDRRLLGLIDAAGPAMAWPLSTIEPDRSARHLPGLMFIGDAAHAMLPYAAQGAAMAIEDGWTAAWAVGGATSPRDAAERYHAVRDNRLRRVRKRVAFHRRVYHLPAPLALARDTVLGFRSGESLARDLGWLYDWTPP
ncbi:salicylate hydroxylase [Aureimonas sp. SA4125]|uniref:FAD-dependent monooxygenase n=1 Tax=Aureimonas sp. SA4125 TaxID=2826993 RepID=UPI001CC7B00C|nr:FAD-dependent monooxygenase [Aureimonas sp. SA4125]BDA84930.1 salicylate hydroxylase [Aureimonas sp. SA4125]